jgi:enamine deaminase RidA (YjgF/YER057c/UK114 family)
MERPLTNWHEICNPPELAPPSGYSHAVIAQGGRTIYLAGQTAQNAEGRIVGQSLVEQFDAAAGNVMTALTAAGGRPEDLVSMQIFVTDVDEYLKARKEIGEAYRRHFGDHYPAMALLQVQRLFDPAAKVELMAIAVSM